MLRRLAVLLGLGLIACVARDEQEIRAEFQAAVDGASSCEVAADCVSVSPGCPLGCEVAVHHSKRAEIEAKARELIDEYERAGRACDYECGVPRVPACTGGRCELHAP